MPLPVRVRPLDPVLQQDMEQRFGHDFSRVRVHSGGSAEQSAREVNAYAYTVGHDIVFGAGQFAPETHAGRRLIAHELTHVVQQSGADGMNVGQSNDKRGLSTIHFFRSPAVAVQRAPVLTEPEALERLAKAEAGAPDAEGGCARLHRRPGGQAWKATRPTVR